MCLYTSRVIHKHKLILAAYFSNNIYINASLKEETVRSLYKNQYFYILGKNSWKSKSKHNFTYSNIWSHHFMGSRWGDSGNSVRLLFFGVPKSVQMVTSAMKLKDAYSLEGKL